MTYFWRAYRRCAERALRGKDVSTYDPVFIDVFQVFDFGGFERDFGGLNTGQRCGQRHPQVFPNAVQRRDLLRCFSKRRLQLSPRTLLMPGVAVRRACWPSDRGRPVANNTHVDEVYNLATASHLGG